MRDRPAGMAAAWRRRHPRALLLGPVALFLAAFVAGPIGAVLRVSLAANPGGTGYGDGVPFYVPGTWTLANYPGSSPTRTSSA